MLSKEAEPPLRKDKMSDEFMSQDIHLRRLGGFNIQDWCDGGPYLSCLPEFIQAIIMATDKASGRWAMPQIDEFVSVSEAKNKLLDLIRRMKHRQEVVAITRDGVPSAVLLSMDQFEGLMETIEILSDQKSMRALRRSLKQAEKGQWVSHDAVFGRENQ
jgi:antitoxin YefM